MIKRRFIGLALLAGSVLPLLAQDVTIDSPDEKLKLTVSCPAGGGSVSYSIVYDGRQMLESSPLGMETNIGNFSDGMKWSGHDVRKIDTVYNQSRIKTSRVHYQANELACEFASTEGQKVGVTFLAPAEWKRELCCQQRADRFSFPATDYHFSLPPERCHDRLETNQTQL